MAVLKDSHTTNINNGTQMFGVNWLAQEFLTTSAYTIASVKLKLARVGAPGIVTASIRKSANDRPTEGDLVSGTYNGDSLGGTPGAYVEFDFGAGYSLSDATKYTIVLRAPTGDNSNYIWFGTSTDSGYADGRASFSGDSGGAWTLAAASRDHGFETYADDPIAYAEGTKVVTTAASVSLTSQNHTSQKGYPTQRPSEYDGDDYWDETNGVWSSTRTTIPGNWAQYMVAVSEEGDIYFKEV